MRTHYARSNDIRSFVDFTLRWGGRGKGMIGNAPPSFVVPRKLDCTSSQKRAILILPIPAALQSVLLLLLLPYAVRCLACACESILHAGIHSCAFLIGVLALVLRVVLAAGLFNKSIIFYSQFPHISFPFFFCVCPFIRRNPIKTEANENRVDRI